MSEERVIGQLWGKGVVGEGGEVGSVLGLIDRR